MSLGVIPQDHEVLLNMVMESNPNIRYGAICDLEGKILWNTHREGVQNILTLEETKKSLQRAIDSWKAREELASKIGPGKYAIVAYDKIKRLTLPLDNRHLLFLSIDNQAGKPDRTDDIVKIVDWLAANPTPP